MADIIDSRRGPNRRPSGTNRERSAGTEKHKRRTAKLLPFCEQVSLGESFTVIVGNVDVDQSPEAPTGHAVIEYNVDLIGRFEIRNRLIDKLKPGSPRTKEGDILLAIRPEPKPVSLPEALGIEKSPPSANKSEGEAKKHPRQLRLELYNRQEVGAQLAGCLLSRGIIALRPKNPRFAAELGQFLKLDRHFDEIGEWFVQQTQAKTVREIVRSLSETSVPIVPAELIQALDDMEESLETVEELSRFGVDSDLLRSRTRNEMDRRLLRLEALSYTLKQAIGETQSLRYLIRNFYPFPIAFRYRAIDSLVDAALRIREQRALAEGIMAFVAAVALACCKPAQGVLMAAGQKKFDFGIGKWLGVARSAVKNLEPGPRHDLLDGLKLLFDGSFDSLASSLVKMRNDDAHDRIEATRLDEATEKFKKLIDDCLEELAFLVRFPLFRVCGAETERSTRASVHQVEMLVGSDPVHDRRTFKWDLSLSPGLYIQGNSGPEDLFPFVTFRRCRHCNRDEIFFLDSFERHAREWKLKSFETGHSLIVDDIGESIAKWVRE